MLVPYMMTSITKGGYPKVETVFFENVIRLVNLKSLTQQDLAEAAQISRPTISKVLSYSNNHPKDIKFLTALAIAKGLNVEFPSLFTRLNTYELSELQKKSYQNERFMDIFITNVNKLNKDRKQNSLSSSPGRSESTISEFLAGKTSNPNLSTFIFIAEVLAIDIHLLFTREGVS